MFQRSDCECKKPTIAREGTQNALDKYDSVGSERRERWPSSCQLSFWTCKRSGRFSFGTHTEARVKKVISGAAFPSSLLLEPHYKSRG